MEITIRKADAADLDAVVRVYEHVHDAEEAGPAQGGWVRGVYDAPDDQIMVLHTLAVDPQAGKRGLGRAFAAFYEQYAREHGCRYLRIDTNERTEALHASNDHRCWI